MSKKSEPDGAAKENPASPGKMSDENKVKQNTLESTFAKPFVTMKRQACWDWAKIFLPGQGM